MTIEHGQLAATQILAAALLAVPGSQDGIGADPKSVPNGITAEAESASGDRYRITVEWLGDREGDAR